MLWIVRIYYQLRLCSIVKILDLTQLMLLENYTEGRCTHIGWLSKMDVYDETKNHLLHNLEYQLWAIGWRSLHGLLVHITSILYYDNLISSKIIKPLEMNSIFNQISSRGLQEQTRKPTLKPSPKNNESSYLNKLISWIIF